MVEQYQIVTVDHDRAAPIAEPAFDGVGLAAGKVEGLVVRILGETAAEFAAARVGDRDDIPSAKPAGDLDDTHRQQAVALF